MLEFSKIHTIHSPQALIGILKHILNSIKLFVLKICYDQCLQIAKITMSQSYFCRNLVYLFCESKGCLIFSPKSFLFLSKGLQKQPYNWVNRFALVIIINNECVRKYPYAVVASFTDNIYISFTIT